MNKEFACKLIETPNEQTIEQLFGGVEGVFWVDWREADENIIDMAALVIGKSEASSEYLLGREWKDGKLYVKFRGKLTIVPLMFEPGEQYITLALVNDAISPEYQIRYVKASEGGDTVAFMVLTAKNLTELEAQFGEKVSEALHPIDRQSAFFKQGEAEQSRCVQRKN